MKYLIAPVAAYGLFWYWVEVDRMTMLVDLVILASFGAIGFAAWRSRGNKPHGAPTKAFPDDIG